MSPCIASIFLSKKMKIALILLAITSVAIAKDLFVHRNDKDAQGTFRVFPSRTKRDSPISAPICKKNRTSIPSNSTARPATVDWIYLQPEKIAKEAGVWVDSSYSQVPPGAVVGGHDKSGAPMYVIRAQHKGALLPGKLVPPNRAHVPWDGYEYGKNEYQVLVNSTNTWVPTTGDDIPPNAFPGGKTEDGETLFIGRVLYKGTITTGKVQKSHGSCYITYEGEEIGFQDYEILVVSEDSGLSYRHHTIKV